MYEKEILVPPAGCGLETTLLENQHKMKGILNGIDEEYWNPEKDPHLIAHYNSFAPIDEAKMAKILQAKADNKKQLRTHLGLKESSAPLVASITRLVPQKGPELIKQALLKTIERGAQFVLLGSSATPVWEKVFSALKKEHGISKNVAIVLDRDEALAHLVYAAADMFIIPSIFEPCGLTQMIALRYGAIPIVRKTGGLADTVHDVDTSPKEEKLRNGYTFDFRVGFISRFRSLFKSTKMAAGHEKRDEPRFQLESQCCRVH
jgi:starch synthase